MQTVPLIDNPFYRRAREALRARGEGSTAPLAEAVVFALLALPDPPAIADRLIDSPSPDGVEPHSIDRAHFDLGVLVGTLDQARQAFRPLDPWDELLGRMDAEPTTPDAGR